MTAAVSTMPDRRQIRQLLERFLPWYDPQEASELHEQTVAMTTESEAARQLANGSRRQVLRASFEQSQARLKRRA